jgi:hypothetical protein
MFKAFKPQKWIVLVFFKHSFSSTICAPFLLKLKRILTLMIRRAKGLELMKIVFITHLNTFGSKVFLTLKVMDFENVALIKKNSYIYI